MTIAYKFSGLFNNNFLIVCCLFLIMELNFDEVLIADLHIHSRFSRACSKNITFENLVKWARIKGLNLLGTGDFTHPTWINEIKEKLKDNGEGFYYSKDGFPFIITGEISLIYTQEWGRRVHLVLLVPSIEIAEKINSYLDTKGRRDYDGRPIFKISCEEFTKEMKKISKDIEVIPAHCLVPNSLIHVKGGLKKIKDITIGDFVLTHKARYKKVTNIYQRNYSGQVIEVVPACMKVGTFFTPEHPIYSIKTYKNCKNVPHTVCKPSCAYLKKGCKAKEFENYKPQFRCIKELEKGDVILYPREKEVKEKNFILLSNFTRGYLNKGYLRARKEKDFIKNVPIKNKIEISKSFCRLVGYYLAEGYGSNDYIAFTFNEDEKYYINDVKNLLREIFGDYFKINLKEEKSKGVSIFVYSKLLSEFFKMFYLDKPYIAKNKILPEWFIFLPPEKLKELVIGWWRGDAGYSVSKNLFNQFKRIFLKIGIVPSISVILSDSVNKRRSLRQNHINGRNIIAKNDLYHFNVLSFFKENLDLLNLPEFKMFKTKLNRRKAWIDEDYVYLPIIKINKKNYKGDVYNLEVDTDNSYLTENLSVHNCWTPWFGVYGSNSGFDSLKEAFGSEFDNIHAIETGMSSDPKMNWGIKDLKDKSIVSFSDAHSFWPFRLGREATIFKKCDSYSELIRQIKENNFLGTVETDPAYGKYHWDGHRNCKFSCGPDKSKKLNNLCPVCKKPLIIGVENRVLELEDKTINYANKKKYFTLLPLHEIIALSIGASNMESNKVWVIYNELIKDFGNEFNILLNVSLDDLLKKIDDKLARLIIKNRLGKIKVKPGYDGEYGVAEL